MEFTYELEYLATRQIKSKDGNSQYNQVKLLCNDDALTFFVNDNIYNKIQAKKLQRFQKIKAHFNISFYNNNIKVTLEDFDLI